MCAVVMCNEASRHTGVMVSIDGIYHWSEGTSFQCTSVATLCVSVFMNAEMSLHMDAVDQTSK